MSFIFTLATLTALPFNIHFDMISNSIAKCVNHSSLFQLYILWGTHVFVAAIFIVVTLIRKNTIYGSKSGEIFGISLRSQENMNPVSRFVFERNIVDVFVCGMAVVGILMLIAPEIFYVRDIYTGGYLRANTMFKFTYAGFIILSVAMVYAIARTFFIVSSKGRYSGICRRVAAGLALLLTTTASRLFCPSADADWRTLSPSALQSTSTIRARRWLRNQTRLCRGRRSST